MRDAVFSGRVLRRVHAVQSGSVAVCGELMAAHRRCLRAVRVGGARLGAPAPARVGRALALGRRDVPRFLLHRDQSDGVVIRCAVRHAGCPVHWIALARAVEAGYGRRSIPPRRLDSADRLRPPLSDCRAGPTALCIRECRRSVCRVRRSS